MRQSTTRPRLAIGTLLVLGALVACTDQLAGTLEPSDASSGVALLSKRQQNRCDNKYVYIPGSFTWDEARNDAKTNEVGSVASISSAEEQACVINAMTAAGLGEGTGVWINGYLDSGAWSWAGSGGQKKNSVFWVGGVSGTAYGYVKWALGQPSGDGLCLDIYRGNDGGWNDAGCWQQKGYILRRP